MSAVDARFMFDVTSRPDSPEFFREGWPELMICPRIYPECLHRIALAKIRCQHCPEVNCGGAAVPLN